MPHTPGPWVEVCESGEWSVVAGLDGPGDYTVVIADTMNMHQPDVDLICAVPDLVGICMGILECLEHGDTWTPAVRKQAAVTLRKVLTRAIGEFPYPANTTEEKATGE